MHFLEVPNGDGIAIHFTLILGGREHTAHCTENIRRAMVDGLLWWAFGQCLGHMMDIRTCAAGQDLHTLYHRTPFVDFDDDRARKAVAHFRHATAALAPLADGQQPAYEQALSILDTLTQRLADAEMRALLGVDGVYTK